MHCVAQTAHKILAAGYAVRVHDVGARQLALDGTFVPEHTRWILLVTAGPRAGQFRIRWIHPDDLYTAARNILGARYVDGKLYAPATSAIEVADFAGRYDFRITAAAQVAIEQHRAAMAAGHVVKARRDDRPVLVSAPQTPQPLAPVQSSGVADGLLDAD
jgi:hypothetical protein